MLATSLPVGSLFGVRLRAHVSFFFLLALAIGYALATTGEALRGLGLWCTLVAAVLVREAARSLAAVYLGLRPRGLLVHPGGSVMALAPGSGRAPAMTLVTWAGPVANIAAGLLLIGATLAIEPAVPLFAQPWFSFHHILRSLVWMQIAMAFIGALPMGGERSFGLGGLGRASRSDGSAGRAPALQLGLVLAMAALLAGALLMNLWLFGLGVLLALASQLTARPGLNGPASATVLVREVMLTEFTLLSSSDTLAGALERTTHSLQEVFPIVRGDRLVGSVSRQTILQRLQMEGDSYLQGVMTRTLRVAGPTEKLVDALKRVSSLGSGELIPVAEGGRMLGILTPQSLSRAMRQVKLVPPSEDSRAGRP